MNVSKDSRPVWAARYARTIIFALAIGWLCVLLCMLAREFSFISTFAESLGCLVASVTAVPLIFFAWRAFDSTFIRTLTIILAVCLAFLGAVAVVGQMGSFDEIPVIGLNSPLRKWLMMLLVVAATSSAGALWYRSLRELAQLNSAAENNESGVVDRQKQDQVEAALWQSEQHLKLAISSAPIVLMSINKDHVIETFDGRALDSVGFAPGQFVGMNIFDFFKGKKDMIRALRIALDGGLPDPVVHTVGQTRMETRCSSVTDSDGNISGLVSICVDVTARENAENILRTISGGTSKHVGADFFESLVKCVSQALDVTYSFVTECVDRPATRISTLAFCNQEQLLPNFEYELKETPCEEVFDGKTVYHGANIQALFPNDSDLVELGVDSYFALPLRDSSGEVIGHLGVLHEDQLPPDITKLPAMQIFAARAAVELERKRSQQAMEQSLSVLNSITDGTSDVICVKDLQGRFTTMNQAGAAMFDKPKEALVGLTDRDLFDPATADRLTRFDRQVIRTGETMTYEVTMTVRGEKKTFLTTKGPIRDVHGQTTGVFAIARDLSERKAMEDALRRSEEFYRLLFDKHIDGVLVLSDHRIQYANPVVSEITGYSNAELSGMRTGQLTVDEESLRIETRGAALYRGAAEYPSEYTFKKKGGGTALVELRSRKININGTPTLISFIRDVTADRQNEQALRLTQFAVDKAGAAIFWIRRDQTFLYVNEAACVSLGYTTEQLMTKKLQDVNSSYRLEDWQVVWKSVQQSQSSTFESIHRRRDGTSFPVEITLNYLEFENEEYLCAYVHDISERKRAEDARRESHTLLRTIIEGTTDVVYLQNLENQYLLINPAGAETLGLPEELIIGKSDVQLYDEQEGAKLRKENEIVVATREPVIRETIVSINGEERVFQTNKAPYRDADGKIVGIIGVCRDITELKKSADKSRQLLADLAHVSRLYTMGEMASGIAHEINQPLAAIGNYTSAIEELINSGQDVSLERLKTMLVRIEKQAYRAGEIIRHLRSLVKRSDPVRNVVDVRDLVSEVVALTSREISLENIDLSIKLPDHAVVVKADPIQIQQVIVNLVRNAIDAMSEQNDQDRKLEIQLLTRGGRAEATIIDSGIGIGPEHVSEVFTAFYSTKPDGMGMGLAISKSIIESHHGRMWYSGAHGCTEFHFTLPLYNGELDLVNVSQSSREAEISNHSPRQNSRPPNFASQSRRENPQENPTTLSRE